MNTKYRNVIGMLPAAGRASRIAPLPFSKELFPVGFGHLAAKSGLRPKVAAHYLLEQMRLAGAEKAFIILRKGKWDIPAYLGDGHMQDMHLAYLIMRRPFGVPYTLDQAYPFVQSATVVFGFPDIVFYPKNAFSRILESLTSSKADIALGIFKVQRRPEKVDMVELDNENRILRIDIKPRRTSLTHTWIAAAWTPVFTEFMHEFLIQDAANRDGPDAQGSLPSNELHLGEVIRAAIASKIKSTVVCFDSGRFLDIGTPEDIIAAANFVQDAESG
jgi:glucose-1-phosphate thymidylyltransferase